MTRRPVTVVVVDDHAVVREGIRRVLESGGISVVAEGANGEEAMLLVARHQPDVLVLDIAMPGRTGVEVAAELTDSGVETRILVLSMYNEPQYILASMRAGAHGYILKDAPPATLREAVRTVAAGKEYLPPALAGRLRAARLAEATPTPLDLLTPRETDVLRGIAGGLTNKEIAARHGISPRTVETHREALMTKLDVRTIAGLTLLAAREGLTEAGTPPSHPPQS
jgi:DNA-binding NarL/FixJ family response regulator